MFLKKFDMLSPKITLYYNKKNIHASPISGVITIIAFLLILTFGILGLISCLYRKKPIIYFAERYIKDVGTFSFNESHNFFNFIQIVNIKNRSNLEIDFNKIEIIGINATMSIFVKEPDKRIFPHWIYDICDNETDIKGIENLIDHTTFGKSACIKYFYNPSKDKYYDINDENFEWPIIKHGVSNSNSTIYGVVIQKCTNSSFRIKNKGICSSEEEINKYLVDVFLFFTIVDHNFDILLYKNPISKFLFPVYCPVETDHYIINNLNFNPGLIINYDNIFYDAKEEQTTYFFEQNSQSISFDEGTKYLGGFFIWLQNSQQYFERHYYKIYNVLSEIGGYANMIIIIAEYINYIIARFNMLSDTNDLLSNIVLNNKSIYNNNIITSKSINKFVENNIHNKKNMNNKILSINRSKIILNTENSDDGKNLSKKNMNINRIKVINNNLGEETNRINRNIENRDPKIITEHNLEIFDKNSSIINDIRNNFLLINKKEKLNCWNYFKYLISFKKNNQDIKHYEDLRRLIISEECMTQNFLNIYNLLQIHHLI